MKHRIPSDPLQEARPAVGSLCPLYWDQGLFHPEESWAWTVNSSSHGRLHQNSECSALLALLLFCAGAEPQGLVSVRPVLN